MSHDLFTSVQEYHTAQAEMQKLREELRNPAPGEFSLLEQDIRGFLSSRCGSILRNIRELYATVTLERDGRLYVTGITMPETHYDRGSGVKLAAKIKDLFLASVRELTQTNPNSPYAKEMVSKAYFCHNTLLDLADFARRAAEEDRIAAARSLRARICALEQTADELESRITALGTASTDFALLTEDSSFATDFGESVAIPLGQTPYDCNGRRIVLPATWDLTQNGIAFVETIEEELEHSSLDALIENAVLKFLTAYPGSVKRVMVCDRLCSAELISFISTLAAGKGCERLFSDSMDDSGCYVYTSASDTEKALSRIPLNERIATTGGQIFHYNRINTENAQPPMLVVLRGFAGTWNGTEIGHIRNLLLNGYKAGVYFLLVDTSDASAYLPAKGKVLHLAFDPEKGMITDTLTNTAFSTELRSESFSLERFCTRLTKTAASSVGAISFDNLNWTRSDKDYSKVLAVPIGKENGREVVMELSSKGSTAHCVIVGMTGSGKSVLLHDIILGLTRIYTPAELELWLFDFKMGVELSPYQKLKHVRRISMNNKSRDGSEMISDILRQMRARLNAIESMQAQDIEAYNGIMRKKGQPLMRRIVIVIDEYTEIKDGTAISSLGTIAQQGRAAGISLILTSLHHDSQFSNVISEAGHRFEFKQQRMGNLIPSLKDPDKGFLSMLPGNCAYFDGTRVHRMRSAFAGDDQAVIPKIEENNAIHKDFAYQKPIIMGRIEAIGTEQQADFDEETVRRAWARNRKISIPMGRSRDGSEVAALLGVDHTRIRLLGDERRCAYVEHTMIRGMTALSGGQNVYYLDFHKDPDRTPNVVMEDEDRTYTYARRNEAIGRAIKELYEIYRKRDRALEDEDDVGAPMLVLIHGAGFLPERLRNITEAWKQGSTRSTAAPTDVRRRSYNSSREVDQELERLQSSRTARRTDSPAAEEEADALKMLATVLTRGDQVRMYTAVHYETPEDLKAVDASVYSCRSHARDTVDTVILPPRMEGEIEVSTNYLTKYLSAVHVDTVSFDKDATISTNELIYGYLASGSSPVRFIPYGEEK